MHWSEPKLHWAKVRADVIVSTEHGTGETIRNNTKAPGGDIEVAGLDPDTLGIRNPARAFFEIGVGNEVFAASSIRIQAIGEAVESGDRQRHPLI